jgi:hypothetical protein
LGALVAPLLLLVLLVCGCRLLLPAVGTVQGLSRCLPTLLLCLL